MTTPARRPAPRPAPPASEEPSSQKQALHDLYKGLPREELLRQGREHLQNHAGARARRGLRLGWVVTWTLIVGSLVVIGVFSIWLLFMAKQSGKSFGDMRRQAISAYATDESP